ncbi:hypothetical protein LIS82_11380 [Cytobacillus solani]|uniref:DUF6115 domain-containing protein n=1 Tax=Cytobacillus solani TaxID=1637975 RepID=UPI00207A9418|nr:hypothetical protein [Cytobacillus solani]USK57038.1 hypothetical protein LIS82_11380 [Cytobacillus solani]
MTTFLLLFSLFLNVLAIFAIIILFLRQNRLLQVERKQEKMISDMEEVISTYLLQMKEENEAFIERVKNMELGSAPINEIDSKKNNSYNEAKDRDNRAIQEEDSNKIHLHSRIGKVTAFKAASVYKQNAHAAAKDIDSKAQKKNEDHSVKLPSLEKNDDEIPNNMEVTFNSTNHLQEDSLLQQILALKEQGFTEDKIAQKLNKGKTEIELLLKFQSNQ